MPDSHVSLTVIEYEFRTLFIYGIICQMHELMLQVLVRRLNVFLGGKSGQTILINIEA